MLIAILQMCISYVQSLISFAFRNFTNVVQCFIPTIFKFLFRCLGNVEYLDPHMGLEPTTLRSMRHPTALQARSAL